MSNMNMIYPSDLVIQGAGFFQNLPDGIEAEHDGRCGMCSKPYAVGELVDYMVIPKTFTVENAIYDPYAPYRCLACAAIMDEKEFLFRWGNAVVTKDGLYPCLKRIHRGYWFTNPPEPPFAFYMQVTKSQHVAWRAPVNYSKEVIFFRLGENVLKIRTHKVIEGRDATNALIEEHQHQFQLKKMKRKPMRTALAYSDMKGQRVGQSELYPWVDELVKIVPDMGSHVAVLLSLSDSEAYALDFVLTEGLQQPEPMLTA